MENKRKGNANSENTDNVYVKEGNDSSLEAADMHDMGYRLTRHQDDSPPTTSPPSKVTSAHGLKNEEYTMFFTQGKP